jgi:hypothetical protein
MFYFCLAIEVFMFASKKVKPGYTGCTNQLSNNQNPKRGAVEVAGALSKACCI